MFVSMEMPILQIEQRLAAMHTHLNMTNVKHGKLGTLGLSKLHDGLTEIKSYGAPFYIVDGNLTATVADVEALARQLKPAAIFIDGGYLLQHPTERDRFKRVAENCSLIKGGLCNLAPTIVSWQFAKPAKGKKKSDEVSMDDIGYSDAIAQISSIALGIFEDETIESVKARKIQVLKGRNGETGQFRTRWEFTHMRFEEIPEVGVEDLQF
jgi:replicative DNA helicase